MLSELVQVPSPFAAIVASRCFGFSASRLLSLASYGDPVENSRRSSSSMGSAAAARGGSMPGPGRPPQAETQAETQAEQGSLQPPSEAQ